MKAFMFILALSGLTSGALYYPASCDGVAMSPLNVDITTGTGFRITPYYYPFSDTSTIDNDPNWWTTGYRSYGRPNVTPTQLVTIDAVALWWVNYNSPSGITGTFNGFNLDQRNVTFEYTGYYRVHLTGVHTFKLTTNGPAALLIGRGNGPCCSNVNGAITNNVVVAQRGSNGQYAIEYSVMLSRHMYYPIRIVYTQPNGIASIWFHVHSLVPSLNKEMFFVFQIDNAFAACSNVQSNVATTLALGTSGAVTGAVTTSLSNNKGTVYKTITDGPSTVTVRTRSSKTALTGIFTTVINGISETASWFTTTINGTPMMAYNILPSSSVTPFGNTSSTITTAITN